MIKATVIILTLNSARKLLRCLKNLSEFEEKIAIDGGSIDNTINILKKNNFKIFHQDKKYKFPNKKIKNFDKIRFKALSYANNNLVLFIDSDEFINNKFINKLKFLSKTQYLSNKIYYYLIRRDVIFENCKITNTGFWPNWHPRLIYKNNIIRYVKPVHEKPVVAFNSHSTVKRLFDEAIYFDFPTSINKINEKIKYYYKIEKLLICNYLNFSSLHFIFFRSLVLTKILLISIKNFFFDRKARFSKIEILYILIYFKFTIKLFFSSLFQLKKIVKN
jgi:glycosyltransferase involved in cell wall biosynthesis